MVPLRAQRQVLLGQEGQESLEESKPSLCSHMSVFFLYIEKWMPNLETRLSKAQVQNPVGIINAIF